MLSKKLLAVLCCPKCHGDLAYEPDKSLLTCKPCRMAYLVENDIPVMMMEEKLRSPIKKDGHHA